LEKHLCLITDRYCHVSICLRIRTVIGILYFRKYWRQDRVWLEEVGECRGFDIVDIGDIRVERRRRCLYQYQVHGTNL